MDYELLTPEIQTHMGKHYAIGIAEVKKDSRFSDNKSLNNLRLSSLQEIPVLSAYRPDDDTCLNEDMLFQPGDIIIAYGKLEEVRSFFEHGLKDRDHVESFEELVA